jgi:NAD-reducing hydrogenase large subunit
VFRQASEDGIVPHTLYYQYARLIEALYGLERIEELLNDPETLGMSSGVSSSEIKPEGIGVIEAPRGTLIITIGWMRKRHNQGKLDSGDRTQQLRP